MELVNRFKTCQAGRKVTERNITYLYLKWQGESEVGTLSSKARTRRHQINLLSIRLKPKEMFYIRLKQKRCFMHTVKLQNAMHQVVVATGSFMWVQKASGHGKKNSDNTWPNGGWVNMPRKWCYVLALSYILIYAPAVFHFGENTWSLCGHSCVHPVCQCQHL